MKSVLLNSEDLSYYNSSSVESRVVSSVPELATVRFVEDAFSAAILNNVNAKRVVKFGNHPGVVTLKSETASYINSFVNIKPSTGYFSSATPLTTDQSKWKLGELVTIDKAASDALKVHVVKPVEVGPRYKSLYLGSERTFTLTISEGSGHFVVTNDNTDMIDLVHKDREILIKPKAQVGMISIKVEDIELPTSDPAFAQVLISDIDKLILWSPRSLMEQGDHMNLIVSAYDSQGDDFDLDQYEDMEFSIETEMTGVLEREFGLKTESTGINTEFNAIGAEPGIYQLTAHTRRALPADVGESMNINSDMMRLEVFPRLDLFPGELLLTPNMKYSLQILGGPQSSVQSFA